MREASTDKAYIQWHSDGYLQLYNEEDSSVLRIRDNITFSTGSGSTNHKVWHAGNDGAGSELDADRLDGNQGIDFARRDGANMTTTTFRVDYADFIVQDDTDGTTN